MSGAWLWGEQSSGQWPEVYKSIQKSLENEHGEAGLPWTGVTVGKLLLLSWGSSSRAHKA